MYTFSECTSLTSVHLPDSLTSIGIRAFADCTSLTSIALPDALTTISTFAFLGCTSLTSVRLPNSLYAISLHTFQGCTALATIDVPPSFPTTPIYNDPDSIERALEEASFYSVKLSRVIGRIITRHASGDDDDDDADDDRKPGNMYFDWKASARIEDRVGRFPLFTAAERSARWFTMRKIFAANMPVIEATDPVTGLEPFMLAAVGKKSDLESIYGLLREYPAAVVQVYVR